MHIRRALADGVTGSELQEVLLHAAVYTGAPAVNAAFSIAERVSRENPRSGRARLLGGSRQAEKYRTT